LISFFVIGGSYNPELALSKGSFSMEDVPVTRSFPFSGNFGPRLQGFCSPKPLSGPVPYLLAPLKKRASFTALSCIPFGRLLHTERTTPLERILFGFFDTLVPFRLSSTLTSDVCFCSETRPWGKPSPVLLCSPPPATAFLLEGTSRPLSRQAPHQRQLL